MYTFPEEVQDNVALYQKVKYRGIVGKQWDFFDYYPGKHEHHEKFVLDKSSDGPFVTCWICFEWDL